ncbi:MAG: CBS domain-containing protein [Nitrospiraceae bacterium]
MKVPNLTMKAREVMNTRVMAVTRRAIGRDMAVQFLTGVYSGLPVVERDGELIGIVTEFDLLKAVQDGKDLHTVTAQDLMSVVPVTVEEDTAIGDVMKQMIKENVLRVPVVRNRKLVGVISRSDLLHHLIEPHLLCVYGSS